LIAATLNSLPLYIHPDMSVAVLHLLRESENALELLRSIVAVPQNLTCPFHRKPPLSSGKAGKVGEKI
jgi:hypothetical protein